MWNGDNRGSLVCVEGERDAWGTYENALYSQPHHSVKLELL